MLVSFSASGLSTRGQPAQLFISDIRIIWPRPTRCNAAHRSGDRKWIHESADSARRLLRDPYNICTLLCV